MTILTRSVLTAAIVLGAVAFSAPDASAQKAACINKGGEGTNSTVDGAKFQAWEAVLQATDWGMWSQFMAGSQKVGDAPGYDVKNVRSKCSPGGIGQNCTIFATLCKK
jgi:hypothetical protein